MESRQLNKLEAQTNVDGQPHELVDKRNRSKTTDETKVHFISADGTMSGVRTSSAKIFIQLATVLILPDSTLGLAMMMRMLFSWPLSLARETKTVRPNI